MPRRTGRTWMLCWVNDAMIDEYRYDRAFDGEPLARGTLEERDIMCDALWIGTVGGSRHLQQLAWRFVGREFCWGFG